MSMAGIKPRVSVMLPSYNYGRYLRETLDSVLAQTFTDFEVIASDDASTDDSVAVLRSYSDTRVRVLVQPRNLGNIRHYAEIYAHCRGEFVAYVDSDDAWRPEKLAQQVAFLDANPQFAGVATYISVCDARGQPQPEHAVAKWCNRSIDLAQPQSWLNHNPICQSSILLRRAAHDAVGSRRAGLSVTADYDLWLRLVAAGHRLAVLPHPLTCYRVHDRGMWHSRGDEDLWQYAFVSATVLNPWFVRLAQPELWKINLLGFISRPQFEPLGQAEQERLLEALLRAPGSEEYVEFRHDCARKELSPGLPLASLAAELLRQRNWSLKVMEARDWHAAAQVFERGEIERLKAEVAHLSERLAELAAREAADASNRALRDYIQEMEAAKRWLDDQRVAWMNQALRLSAAPVHRLLAERCASRVIAWRGRFERAIERVLGRSRWQAFKTRCRRAAVWQEQSPVHLRSAPSAISPLDRLAFPEYPPDAFVARTAPVIEGPWVTVVIPCWAVDEAVRAALDSVKAQTWSDWEVLLVNCSAADFSVDPVFGEKVRVCRQDRHGGCGSDRDFAWKIARGHLVCWLDPENRLMPTVLERAVYAFTRHTIDVAVFLGGFAAAGSADREGLVFRRSWIETIGGFPASTVADSVRSPVEELLEMAQRHKAIVHRFEAFASVEPRTRFAELTRALAARSASRVRVVAGVWSDGDGIASVKSQPTILISLPFLVVGGGETLVSQLGAYLASAGWRVIVVASLPTGPEHGDATRWFEAFTHEVYNLPHLVPDSWRRDWILFQLRAKRVDIIWQVGSPLFYEIAREIRAARPEIKLVDLLFNCGVHAQANSSMPGVFDLTLCESEEVKNFITSRGVPTEKVKCVTSGVDLEKFAPRQPDADIRAQIGADGEQLVVGFIGRWSEEKGPDLFVEIARKVAAMAPGVRFLMTGSGPMAEAVQRLIVRAELGARLRCFGIVDDVRPYMASCDVLLLPSRLDGRPLAVLQAMSMARAVVASRVGALPDLLQDGKTGFLCRPGEVDDFVEVVHALALAPQRAREVGAEARAWAVQHIDHRRAAREYESVFKGLLPAQ